MSQENLSPACIRRIANELKKLSTKPPDGIKIFLNESNITDIQALIDGPEGTPYENGVFRVRLKLGSDFPQSPPKGIFVTKIFHPNVSKTGEICVNTLKKDWKEDLGIEHVLLTIKCLLIAPNPESSLNEEAGRLLLERYEDYAKHARLLTKIHASKSTEISSEGSSSGSTPQSAPSVTVPKKTVSKSVTKDNEKKQKKKSLKRL